MVRPELEQDLGRDSRVATLAHELDSLVQVGLAVRQPLGQVHRVAGLDQDVQPPARDSLALRLVMFGDLGHGRRWLIRPFKDEPCLRKLGTSRLAARGDRLVGATGQLLQTTVERSALRLGFVRQAAHSVPQLELELAEPRVQ
jgi:hypothetical protein